MSIIVSREFFVKGESINLGVSLLNDSSYPIRIEDITMQNNPLYFYAVSDAGKEYFGSLQSPRIRDGLSFPPVRQKSLILLHPKTRTALNIDLLDILGELAEGNYEVKAEYISHGILFVESNKVSIRILKSTPFYSKTFQDYQRVDACPIRTAWINREQDGLHVLIMENSQYNPPNIRSNRRILKIDEVQKVCPSILASPEQYNEHLMWIQDETLNVATIEQRILKDTKNVKLPIQGFQILEPTFTSEDGKLYIIAALKKKGLTFFQLISYSNEDKVEVGEICKFDGDFAKYCITYDEESRLHMTWALGAGSIFYTWYDLEQSIKAGREPEMLVTCKPPVLDLQLSKACEDEEGNLQLLLHFANCEFPDELHSRLINVDSKKELSHSFFPLPKLGSLVLIQTVLDLECRPHYLFQDSAGALWFKAFEGAELVRVTEEGEAYPGNVDHPVMLVSSNQSPNYGIYLRYIKDGSRFVYKKLESLE